LIIIADDRKCSSNLLEKWKQGIPLEVLPLALKPIELKLNNLILNNNISFRAVLRECKSGKAGPIVTDNGNFVIDLQSSSPLPVDSIHELNSILKNIAGIVETGIFECDKVTECFFGAADGSVKRLKGKLLNL